MENNDNDLQRQPLIPEQRQQGKTVQTILIKKKWTEPIEMFILHPFFISYTERFFLVDYMDWIECFLLMIARRGKEIHVWH